MTAVKNKIPNVSDLVKETDCRAKILDIEFKYFTAADYNKFLSQTLNAKIKEEELVDKSAIAEFINNADSDNISSNISNESRIKSKAIQSKKFIRIWFKLFSWKKSFWRWFYSKLFSISASV